jgi:hypothetical protein
MDYHIKPIGKTCAATGDELVPGSRCYSVLVEQDGQRIRLDFSEGGWNGPPEGTIGFWRAIVPEEQAKAPSFDSDAMLRCFEQMSEGTNIAQEKLKYVLALLLLQKRRLKIEGSRQDGEIEYLEVIGSQGEGPFEVRDHHLEDDEIKQLQAELNAYLAQEWA